MTTLAKDVCINVVRLCPDAALPDYQYPDDAGADIHAIHAINLQPFERKLISTGLRVELPQGIELQIRPRSGLAQKHGVTVLNSPGTIDSGYRGEIKILLINLGQKPCSLKKGERIAQIVAASVTKIIYHEVSDVNTKTDRGAQGFGSTDDD